MRMWVVGVLVVAGISHPRQVRAESLAIPLGLYAVAAAADLHSTHNFLQYEGFREANPMGGWLSDRPNTLVVASALTDAAIVYGLHRLVHTRWPRFEKVALYGAASIRLMLAKDNYDVVRGRKRK